MDFLSMCQIGIFEGEILQVRIDSGFRGRIGVNKEI